jgi:hypothetical protein
VTGLYLWNEMLTTAPQFLAACLVHARLAVVVLESVPNLAPAEANSLVPFQLVHCTLDTGTAAPNPGNSSLMNTTQNCLGILCILACLGAPVFGQQTGTSVGATPGSALHGQKTTATAQKLETSSLRVSCDSVSDVMIVDPRGRRLGDDPKAQAHFDEIPNAYFEAGGLDDDETGEADDDPAKILFIPTPASGDFKLTIFSEKTGNYSCEFLGYDNSGGTSHVELNDIAAKSGDVQTVTLSFSGAPGSKIKVNGLPVSTRTP